MLVIYYLQHFALLLFAWMLFEFVCTLVAGNYSFVVVQSFIRVLLFVTPYTEACQDFLSVTISRSLLKLMSIESVIISNHLLLYHPLLLLPSILSIDSVMPSNHLTFCHPLLLPSSIFPSIRVFSNESVLHSRWPKYWSFSFSISSFSEYAGLISFRIDWFDLLAVQETL